MYGSTDTIELSIDPLVVERPLYDLNPMLRKYPEVKNEQIEYMLTLEGHKDSLVYGLCVGIKLYLKGPAELIAAVAERFQRDCVTKCDASASSA